MTDFDLSLKTIDIGEENYNYYKFGSGKPLLTITGFHTNFERVKPLLLILAEHFTVYFPILPGIHTRQPLTGPNGISKIHSSENYAVYINSWVEALKLKDYILSGFCYGALVAIRMLSINNNSAKNLLLFEPLCDGSNIHIEKYVNSFIKLVIKLGRENKLNNKMVDFLIHNETFLKFYFKSKLKSENNLNEAINHQISLTTMMDTRATIDLIKEIFTLKLSDENLLFKIPSILIFNKTDDIFDIPKIKNAITKILPNNQIFEIVMKHHAPATPMDNSYVSELISPILPAIINLKD